MIMPRPSSTLIRRQRACGSGRAGRRGGAVARAWRSDAGTAPSIDFAYPFRLSAGTRVGIDQPAAALGRPQAGTYGRAEQVDPGTAARGRRSGPTARCPG